MNPPDTAVISASYGQAVKSEHSDLWNDAMGLEFWTLKDMGTFVLTDISDVPAGKQVKGVDYTQTFSPTVAHTVIRMIMALTALPSFKSIELDATAAFVSALLPEEEIIYCNGPPGLAQPEGKVYKVVRSLYGMAQSSHLFHKLCKEIYVEKCGLRQLTEI